MPEQRRHEKFGQVHGPTGPTRPTWPLGFRSVPMRFQCIYCVLFFLAALGNPFISQRFSKNGHQVSAVCMNQSGLKAAYHMLDHRRNRVWINCIGRATAGAKIAKLPVTVAALAGFDQRTGALQHYPLPSLSTTCTRYQDHVSISMSY